MKINRIIYIATVLQVLAIDFASATKRAASDDWPTSLSLRLMTAHSTELPKPTQIHLPIEDVITPHQYDLDDFEIFEKNNNKKIEFHIFSASESDISLTPETTPVRSARRKLEF